MDNTQLDHLQHGDLIFYKVTPQSWWLSRLIAVIQIICKEGKTDTQYSHCSILDYDQTQQLEGIWPKTRISKIDWSDPNIEVWRVKNLTSKQHHAALTWTYCHLDRPYDIGQILLGLFTWSSAYTCSEFVVEAYRHVGIDLASDAGRFIGPNELVSPLIERVLQFNYG